MKGDCSFYRLNPDRSMTCVLLVRDISERDYEQLKRDHKAKLRQRYAGSYFRQWMSK